MSNLKSQISNLKTLASFYLITIIALFFYSFTQVDLNLTLSRWSVWQVIEKFFQHIGYFNRPLSTSFFIAIIASLFIFYMIFLFLSYKNKISEKQVWYLIILTAVILLFSYNAFSYDLFNYIFDAKIITYYRQNPYLHRALDFPADPMLSFMRWTHRFYPYGPVWLVLTVPLSFVGFNHFLPTFFLFKFLGVLSFLGTAFFIGRILRKISPEDKIFGLILFAFNPLVIIEGLVSAHNDMPMMFFAILSLYLFLERKHFYSFVSLLLSIGIKFATAFIIPVYVYLLFKRRQKEINWNKIFISIILLMIVPIIIATIRTNFQPWYLLYVLSFTAFIKKSFYVIIPVIVLSFFSLLEYVPFLYLGNWNPPVPFILNLIMVISIIVSIVLIIGWRFRQKYA